jgi:hypothetical protein
MPKSGWRLTERVCWLTLPSFARKEDGKGSIAIRRATDEECSIWRENSEGLNGDEEHDADDFVVFLVGQAPEEEE